MAEISAAPVLIPGMLCSWLQVVTCVRMIGDLLASEDPAFKMNPKPQVTSRFNVLPEMIGPAIIGKGGTHAKHIKERTGCRIEVVREYLCNAAADSIAVWGTSLHAANECASLQRLHAQV